jgi:hypothetical protein
MPERREGCCRSRRYDARMTDDEPQEAQHGAWYIVVAETRGPLADEPSGFKTREAAEEHHRDVLGGADGLEIVWMPTPTVEH